jgi:hypothetical protein
MSALAMVEVEYVRRPIAMSTPAPCPFCYLGGGFHDEDVHSARPLPEGKALPVGEPVAMCRACGEPLSGPGEPGCRYPKHVTHI